MKNSRKCPKCGGTDVVVIEPWLYNNSFPIGVFAAAKLERWACCDCGYSEEWVEQGTLKDVKKYWGKSQDD